MHYTHTEMTWMARSDTTSVVVWSLTMVAGVLMALAAFSLLGLGGAFLFGLLSTGFVALVHQSDRALRSNLIGPVAFFTTAPRYDSLADDGERNQEDEVEYLKSIGE